MDTDYNRVFIIGCPRSGTTWVSRMFAGHPDVVHPGIETRLFTTLGPFIREDNHFDDNWAAIVAEYDAYPRLRPLISRRELLTCIHFLRNTSFSQKEKAQQLVDMVLSEFFIRHGGDGSKTLVEKTPHHYENVKEIVELYPRAKIICLLRDGRDVCVSFQKMVERGMKWFSADREEQIMRWKSFADSYLQFMSDPDLKDSIISVRYEDLREYPHRELRRLLEYSGLSAPARIVTELVEWNDILNMTDTDKLVYKGAVGVWKQEFSEADNKLFKQICGDTFTAIGYEY